MKRFLLLFLLLFSLGADDQNLSDESFYFTKGEKVLLTNVVMAGVITAWGFSQWEYGTEDLHMGNEGWFGKDTSNGGLDKLGHFYTNYLLTRIMAPIFEGWGYSREDAALYSSLTAAIQSIVVMEVGRSMGFPVRPVTGDCSAFSNYYQTPYAYLPYNYEWE